MPSTSDWRDELEEGVLLHDGRVVSWLNLAASRFLGVPQAEAVGAPLIVVLRDHRLERVALGGEPVELIRRGRTLRVRGVPGALLFADVSEAREALAGAEELLAVLSHELRTPATTISAALEALAEEPPEPLRQRFRDHARREAGRLVRLVGDLTTSTKPPRERHVELAESASRAAAILETKLREREVRVVISVDQAVAWADEDKLLQVLLNLIENAVKHGPRAAEVRVTAGEARPGWWKVSVSDEGKPIPPDQRRRLFGAIRGTRGPSGGSGLGLYITRSIVQGWGGEVWLEPDPSGNRFSFTLPAAAGH